MHLTLKQRLVAALCLLLTGVAGMTGCSAIGEIGIEEVFKRPLHIEPASASSESASERNNNLSTSQLPTDAPGLGRKDIRFTRLGSEQFVAEPRRNEEGNRGDVDAGDGAFTLNFQAAELREVIKVILSDLLQASYVVDPAVQGGVSLQTNRPLTQEQLLPTLEMLLRMNGAALVADGEQFRVTTIAKAAQSAVTPQLGDSKSPIPPGFGIRIVPLTHIAAVEMAGILEPLATPGNLIRIDARRNLLIFSGSSPELKRLIETVEIFDVDWLAGMSMGLFTPDYVDVVTLSNELRKIFELDAKGSVENMLRVVPLERLNALLVVATNRRHLKSVTEWIDRLDQNVGDAGQSLFVYRVRNSKAVDLADTLGQLFSSPSQQSIAPPVLAPGLRATSVGSEPPGTVAASRLQTEIPPSNEGAVAVSRPNSSVDTARKRKLDKLQRNAQRPALRAVTSPDKAPKIIADEPNNALLISATRKQYQQIRAALIQLDVVPLQVLIETTIAEITLTDELRHGLEWFFRHSGGKSSGRVQIDVDAIGLSALAPGFSYALTDAAGVVRAVLNSLASDSKLNVVSSPSIMVLNNQEARIRVGDEVPITTQQQQSTTTDANIINTIEFRETGVLLSVKPRVNPGGLVIMDIEQEVSDVAPGTGATLTPTIQKRMITSSVAVQSGQTVVLGGLIRENRTVQRSGLPGLYRLPVIGGLLGSHNDDKRRTELVILITPRAISDEAEAARVTREFREKMEGLRPISND